MWIDFRHFALRLETPRDCGWDDWHLGVYVGRRPSPLPGEGQTRLYVNVFYNRRGGFCCYWGTWPAWKDEPSVVAEWQRTMRS